MSWNMLPLKSELAHISSSKAPDQSANPTFLITNLGHANCSTVHHINKISSFHFVSSHIVRHIG